MYAGQTTGLNADAKPRDAATRSFESIIYVNKRSTSHFACGVAILLGAY